MTATTKSKNNKDWRVYKPNKQGTGAASAVEFKVRPNNKGYDEATMFWVATKQVESKDENAAFGWKEKSLTVTLKLDEPDIGELLAVLRGIKGNAGTDKGIYHSNDNGSTSFSFTHSEGKGYYVRLAVKRGSEPLVEVKHTLSYAEGTVLETLLSRAIVKMYDWS